MNVELNKIKEWLASCGYYPQAYCDLSKNKDGDALVNDNTVGAYNFDDVVSYFYNESTINRSSSCDGLLLKSHLYLIEFKNLGKQSGGFLALGPNTLSNSALKQVVTILAKVESKLIESLYLLDKKIIAPLEVDDSKFEKRAIVIYNGDENAVKATAQARGRVSGRRNSKWGNHARFAAKGKTGERIFFDKVQVIPSTMFSTEIKKIT